MAGLGQHGGGRLRDVAGRISGSDRVHSCAGEQPREQAEQGDEEGRQRLESPIEDSVPGWATWFVPWAQVEPPLSRDGNAAPAP
ncbi:hypothetical protein [Streptomyces sp. NPDC013457]|uniref:hypothetical protein n=1 Tax=Streptomyces sp. NPDC013457 TaxID=3364866 RepID=UPI0036FBB7A5